LPAWLESRSAGEGLCRCSLDYLVCTREQHVWYRQAERLSRFQINDQAEFCRLLDGKIGRSGTLQDLGDIGSGTPVEIGVNDFIGHQATAISGESRIGIDSRQFVASREFGHTRAQLGKCFPSW